MYSMSSSENDCEARFCYDPGFRGASDAPVYPHADGHGHPLVYYMQVPQNHWPQRNRMNKKNNPNCFVKAFRWYTQELPSQPESPANNVDIGGFAVWLDKKYEEFLDESKCEQNYIHCRSKQYSETKNDRIANRLDFLPRKTRKFPLKSPWRRKRRFKNDTEITNEKHSFEFILQPQDMSRTASECCQMTPCCVRSDTTFVTSRSGNPTKNKIKSHSVMCLTKRRDKFERNIKITHNVSKGNIERHKSAGTTRILTDYTSVTNHALYSNSRVKITTKNTSCECTQDNFDYKKLNTKRNYNKAVVCQCSNNTLKTDEACQHSETGDQVMINIKPERLQIQGDIYHTCCQCRQPLESISQLSPKNIRSVKNLKQKDPPISNELLGQGVQTSDHSIIFEESPLVVKLLCEK